MIKALILFIFILYLLNTLLEKGEILIERLYKIYKRSKKNRNVYNNERK